MNTAERRWVVVASFQTPDEWDRLLFRIADFRVEAIVENEASGEIYFANSDEAIACAAALGVAGPRVTAEGTGEVFGRHSHPTTELCLELLPAAIDGRSVDIGSGTGRLAAEAAVVARHWWLRSTWIGQLRGQRGIY